MSTPGPLMSPNDELWLTLDTHENLMVIESVLWFSRPLDLDAVRTALGERLVGRYPVMSWRPEEAPGGLGLHHWVPDEHFDIDRHIVVHRTDGDGRAHLRALLEEQMAEPLPRDRPLWQAHLVEAPEFGAIIMRFHHALADGTALARVLIELTTDTPEGHDYDAARRGAGTRQHGADPTTPHRRVEPVPGVRPGRGVRERAVNALTQVATLPLAAGVAATNTAAGLARLLDPDHPDGAVARLTAMAVGTADAVDKLVIGTPPDIVLFGQPGVAKRADWSAGHDLADIKRLARRHGATVNDVMVAGISGALRRYVLSRGEVPQDVVTMVPVNLRPVDQPLPAHLGNKFALVAIALPLAEPTPLARLAASRARMNVIKSGPEAFLTFGLAHAIGAVGAVTDSGSRLMASFFSNKAIGVTTNVPGPDHPRYFAGEELRGLLGWVPGASRQAIGVSIVSYDGVVRVGFKTDARVVPDVANLVAAHEEEMADLLAEAR